MVRFFKSFLSYVPSKPLPEIPRDEPLDININKQLSESYRVARRNLVALCGLSLAWSSAQFSILDPRIDIAGISFQINTLSIPTVFFLLMIYLTARWGIEFAMMEREIRRWTLAQLDFRLVAVLTRLSLIALAAGAINQSLQTVVSVALILVALAAFSMVLSILLMFITMPIRLRARAKAQRVSVANSAFEAFCWATFLAIILCVIGVISLGIASYNYEPLRNLIWPTLPNPVTLIIFVVTLITVFLSYWFLQPLYNFLLSVRPNYSTRRDEEGNLIYTFPRE